MADPYIVICRPSGDTISVIGYFKTRGAASIWANQHVKDAPWTASRPIDPTAFIAIRDYHIAHRAVTKLGLEVSDA